MKRIMKLYESCRTSIKVAFFACVLIGIGSFIQNDNVNLFYTFKSSIILFIGEFCLRLGEFILMNLPLIFTLNVVCKKENNSSPVIMALVGYFTFMVTTMLFSSQSLDSQAYVHQYGINSIFNLGTGTRYPLETGMIGSFIVAYATRCAFIFSRHRGNYSLTNIFSKDIAGLIYNVLFCFLGGLLTSYAYPFLFNYLQKAILFISEDLSDPLRIAIYSALDRIFSILGLGNVIRYPFWFTALGGSSQNVATGQSIFGDVNIWTSVKNGVANYFGAGRFITPYYVINMFIIPGIYIGTFLSISDKKDRRVLFIPFIIATIFSIIAGNPLPMELIMLFTSPALLFMYLFGVGVTSFLLVNRQAFLGFSYLGTNLNIALPGIFPDFIANLRDAGMSTTLTTIIIIGLIALIASIFMTLFYYHIIAFDFASSDNGNKIVKDIIAAVGGTANIDYAGSGILKLNIYLKNPELISIEQVQEIGPRRVYETRNGIVFEFGTSSYAIAKKINRLLKRNLVSN